MGDIYSPITGEVIATVPDADAAAVSAAIARAQAGAEVWADVSPMERARILRKLSQLMLEREDEFAKVETNNLGAPYRSSLAMVRRAASSFEYFASRAETVVGEVIPVEGEYFTYAQREPHGVVAAIVPWNAPIIFATKKIAPAIAFGNSCILKPAPETPLSALLLAEVLADSDLPEGVVQVITGGREAGEALTQDPRVDLIVFTGHDATGINIAKSAATHLIPTALELGGKSAQVVFADAPSQRVVDGLLAGIYGNAGQACIAGSRIIVEESFAPELTQLIAARTRDVVVGDPFDPDTQVGPQATKAQQEKTLAMVARSVSEGATIAAQAPAPTSAHLERGFFTQPTLITDVHGEMDIVRNEVFGPVAVMQTFKTEAEAIALANDTEYGLAAGVWTSDGARAQRVARKLRAGTVWVNTYDVISDRVPFGGIGRSGYGREGGTSAVELYTRVKSVWTSLHQNELSSEIQL